MPHKKATYWKKKKTCQGFFLPNCTWREILLKWLAEEQAGSQPYKNFTFTRSLKKNKSLEASCNSKGVRGALLQWQSWLSSRLVCDASQWRSLQRFLHVYLWWIIGHQVTKAALERSEEATCRGNRCGQRVWTRCISSLWIRFKTLKRETCR